MSRLARLLCRVGFHNWSMWSEAQDMKFAQTRGGSIVVAVVQERRCQDCRIHDLKARSHR